MRSEKDRRKIRDLAKIVKEISQYPMMQDRTKQWKAHNSLKSRQPLVLVFPEGSWRELLPASNLTCEADNARCIEWELRKRIYKYENIYDDTVFEDKWIVTKSIADTGWGLAPKRIVLDENEKPGRMQTAYRYEPLIHVPADLKKLKYPEVVYDEKDSIQRYEAAQELFGDILNVEVRGTGQLSFCYTPLYSKLRGLSQVMLDMFEEPNMLHDAMAFMEQGYEKLIEQYVQMNLLSLNNDSTYHSSGGIGFTDELPKDGFDPENVRPQDIWASAQSQEMSGVSPEMHYEFIMKHEIKSLRHFGLNGYGCCENLTQKMKYVFEIPTIRRISISPWADVEECADNLKDKYIYSWKPNPAYLAGNDFDEVFIRNYIQHTLEATKDCVLEIILKDTHTCRNEPERITKWTQIVRDAIEKS
ncbi:hypothetical protein JW960_28495 [candidate division KSB1 bacterium]|nr:hypothetical protein [candidate division KSB1 bacterium]